MRLLTLNVRESGMSSNFDIMFLAVADRLLHYQRIACMKAAGDIGMVDQRQEFKIRTTNVVPILIQLQILSTKGQRTPTASPKSTLSSALCLIGGGVMLNNMDSQSLTRMNLGRRFSTFWHVPLSIYCLFKGFLFGSREQPRISANKHPYVTRRFF